eukprot:CAMPEP_0118934394 /NCGR_PEP_ID=MMETSP1169-20130426/13803_1 /TAXON_ID=36882 /ORGANISM="Pyramimonas obovata, Strain CCMP722" /LENGTH=75 /DNA_ID=CAMNT_0006877297 /DNA_START=151 /DNA_END=375 /DNA_ORIENTATION=-
MFKQPTPRSLQRMAASNLQLATSRLDKMSVKAGITRSWCFVQLLRNVDRMACTLKGWIQGVYRESCVSGNNASKV